MSDTIHGAFPTHGVLWSTEHGFHIEVRDATGAVASRQPATPATKATLIERLPDGSAVVEVQGPTHHGSDALRRSGSRRHDEPAERITVPPLDRAEHHVESEANGHTATGSRTQAGPHWIDDRTTHLEGLFECRAAEWTANGWRGTPAGTGKLVEMHSDGTATIELSNGERTRVASLARAEFLGDQIGPHFALPDDGDQ